MLFLLQQVSEAINIQKNEVILNTYSIVELSPNMGQIVQDSFFTSSVGTSDRYVQQIYRAMTTYNFCNFNILGIFQFTLTYCSASYFIPKHMFK